MNKKSNTNRHEKSRSLIIKQIAHEFNYSEGYIRECLLAPQLNETAVEINKRYQELLTEIKKVLTRI